MHARMYVHMCRDTARAAATCDRIRRRDASIPRARKSVSVLAMCDPPTAVPCAPHQRTAHQYRTSVPQISIPVQYRSTVPQTSTLVQNSSKVQQYSTADQYRSSVPQHGTADQYRRSVPRYSTAAPSCSAVAQTSTAGHHHGTVLQVSPAVQHKPPLTACHAAPLQHSAHPTPLPCCCARHGSAHP